MSDDVHSFMGVTGASEQVAKSYLDRAGQVDAAVALFYEEQDEGGENMQDEDEEEEDDDDQGSGGGSPTQPAPAAVDSILGKARDTRDKQEESAKWGGGIRLGGGGSSTNPPDAEASAQDAPSAGSAPKKIRSVHIWFFADGFTVNDAPSKEDEDAVSGKSAAASKPAPRRTGMASLSDYKKPAPERGAMPKMPKLPPLRSYTDQANASFLAELKEGRVPHELRSRDEETGEPIGVSIVVSDFRPEAYPKEIAEMQQKMQERMDQGGGASGPSGGSGGSSSAIFSGAGHTLSSSGPSGGAVAGSGTSSGPSGGSAPSSGGSGIDPALAAIVSGPKPVADESKPTTVIQLRLASGARIKAKLNLDHTVAALWQLVAAEMGQDAFAAASQHELVAGFPPKPLSDFKITLKDADLANAAVTHRCR